MKARDVADYLFLALTWGLSFLVVLKVVQAFGWIGAVSFRALVAGLTLFVLARAAGWTLRFAGQLRALTVVGATTVAGQLVGLSYATPRIGTAMAAIFVASIPLFSLLIGRLWGERISLSGVLGLLLGFIGIVLLVGFPAVPVTPVFIAGCAASLASAFCAAFGSQYVNHRLRGARPWEVTCGAFLIGGALTLPLLLAVPVPSRPTLPDYGLLLVAGCLMSALTYVLYFRLVGSIGATRAISVEFAVTVVAVLIGALLLGEPLSAAQLAGGLVIVCGCALVLGLLRLPRRLRA